MSVIDLSTFSEYWPYRDSGLVMTEPASPVQAQANMAAIKTALEALDSEDSQNGRGISEASPVTDASKEFLAGGTFTLNPTNSRHYNIKVADTATALTDNMTIALGPTNTNWSVGDKVTIVKGDTSDFTITVSGFDVDGIGTYVLSRYRDFITCVYQDTDAASGPGASGEKFERGAQGRITPKATDVTAAANVTNGPSGATVQAQLDEQAIVVKSSSAWAADTTTVLGTRQTGRESDTGKEKAGNGSDLWADLVYTGSGSGHDAVTLNGTAPVTLTGDTTLVASHCTWGLSGQELWHDRFVFVDPAGATELTLSDTLAVGKQIDLQIVDVDSAVTIIRPTVAETGTFTSNGTDTITGADTSMVRVGDVVSATSVTSSQTVLSIVTDTSVTLSAAADGSETAGTFTFTGKRGVFNGNESDITCKKGKVIVQVISDTTGIDAEIFGATTEGFGEINTVTETADFSLSSTHFGKATFLDKTTGTHTVSIDTPGALGASVGVVVQLFAGEAGATTFTISPTGAAVDGTFIRPATDSLNITVKGTAVLTAKSSTKWFLSGNMVAA